MRNQRRPAMAFVVGGEYVGPFQVGIGLRWLLAQEGEPVIVVPQQSQFRDSALVELVGDDLAARLGQGGAHLGEPPRLVHGATWRTFPPTGWTPGPVLALWPDSATLGKLEARGATAICAVPWSPADEVGMWARARRAIDLTRPDSGPLEAPIIRDPVVEAAMRHVTTAVNLSSGLLDGRDRSSAVEAFRLLQRGGHSWKPDEIKAWALANGWLVRATAPDSTSFPTMCWTELRSRPVADAMAAGRRIGES